MTGLPVSRIQCFEISVHEVHDIYSLISATLDILSIAVSALIPTKCIKLQFKNQCWHVNYKPLLYFSGWKHILVYLIPGQTSHTFSTIVTLYWAFMVNGTSSAVVVEKRLCEPRCRLICKETRTQIQTAVHLYIRDLLSSFILETCCPPLY